MTDGERARSSPPVSSFHAPNPPLVSDERIMVAETQKLRALVAVGDQDDRRRFLDGLAIALIGSNAPRLGHTDLGTPVQ